MRLACFVGVTDVRREDAEGDDPDPLLASLLAGTLPSKLSKSALARSPKVLSRLRSVVGRKLRARLDRRFWQRRIGPRNARGGAVVRKREVRR